MCLYRIISVYKRVEEYLGYLVYITTDGAYNEFYKNKKIARPPSGYVHIIQDTLHVSIYKYTTNT